MQKLQNYKISANPIVLQFLSNQQKENLFGDNIFLQVREYIIREKLVIQGIIIVYDWDKNPICNSVKKAIPTLLEHAVKVNSLPTNTLPAK